MLEDCSQVLPKPPPVVPHILASGGGKGGVGKSVITANLAVALARSGKRCVLLDADLGGANLHTLFGLAHPRTSLADLFARRVSHLRDLLVPTGIPGLHLISGAQPLHNMANPLHSQKQKVLRQLTALDVDCLLLDLGAGSSFNVLDFFLAADTQLLVVTPLPTSVENAYQFLKAGFYRMLKRVVREVGLERQTEELLKSRQAAGIRSPGELLAFLHQTHPQQGGAVIRAMSAFAPQIIVNQVRGETDKDLGHQMAVAASDYFGLPVTAVASILNDERVPNSIQRRMPVLELFPQASFSQSVRELGRWLLDHEESSDEPNRSASGV